MQKDISPCLWFDSQAKEAAEFYCTVFKNSNCDLCDLYDLYDYFS